MSQLNINHENIQPSTQPHQHINMNPQGNIPPTLQNPSVAPVPNPVVNPALQNGLNLQPVNLQNLQGQQGSQSIQMNGPQPPHEIAQQHNVDLADTLEDVFLHGALVTDLPEPMQQVLKNCRNEVIFHYGSEVIPDNGTVISLLSPEAVKTF